MNSRIRREVAMGVLGDVVAVEHIMLWSTRAGKAPRELDGDEFMDLLVAYNPASQPGAASTAGNALGLAGLSLVIIGAVPAERLRVAREASDPTGSVPLEPVDCVCAAVALTIQHVDEPVLFEVRKAGANAERRLLTTLPGQIENELSAVLDAGLRVHEVDYDLKSSLAAVREETGKPFPARFDLALFDRCAARVGNASVRMSRSTVVPFA